MVLKYLLSGFFVKLIAGFDDTMVHIPIISNITHTQKGRISFSLGILLAISCAVLLSFFLASFIKSFPHFKYISSGMIFLLAILIYFDIFIHKPREGIEKKLKHISTRRILKLLVIGFLTAFATVIDDTIAYSSLFLGSFSNISYAIIGIFSATFVELTVVIYFSKKISEIKYKKEITTIGLIILGFLILFNVL